MKRKVSHVFLIISVILVFSISLVSANGDKETAAAEKEDKILRIAMEKGPSTLGMLRADGYATSITQNISDALTRLNDEGDLEPGLATSWEWIDELTWQFKLREGVVFTNGEPFNADAVVYNLTSMTDRELAYRYKSHWGTAWPITIEKVDEYTINIKTEAANAFIPNLLTRIVMYAPKQWKAEGDEVYFTHPAGVGPYVVESWDLGISLVLKKAETEYWDGDVYFDEVVIDAVSDQSARISGLQSGDYEISEAIPLDQIENLEKLSDDYYFDIFRTVGLNWTRINFNVPKDNWMWNVKFREAMVLAIDQDAINTYLFGGLTAPMSGVASELSFGGDAGTKANNYDPERSKQLLKEIGYDGALIRLYMTTGEFGNDVQVGEFIASQLTQVGINVEFKQLEKAAITEKQNSGEFEMDLANTPGPFGGTSDYYWNQMVKRGYAEGDDFADMPGYYSAAAGYGLTTEERKEKLREVNALLWEKFPYIFAVESRIGVGFQSNIKGTRLAINSWLFFKDAYIEK